VKAALIDNGSLEPASQRNLRAVAAAIGRSAGIPMEAVSWKHSDRIPAADLDGVAAWTAGPWIRSQVAAGERHFTFIPFFISSQGAVGSALRAEVEAVAGDLPDVTVQFTGSIADDSGDNAAPLAEIVAARVREAIAAEGLRSPAVIVVDHGGPSRASAGLRDAVAAGVRLRLGAAAGRLAAASMETPEGPEFAFNQPLFAELLETPGFAEGDVVIAPLFLSPGRHAGPGGDLSTIARAAAARRPGLRCHFAELVGTHPLAVEILSRRLRTALEGSTLFFK